MGKAKIAKQGKGVTSAITTVDGVQVVDTGSENVYADMVQSAIKQHGISTLALTGIIEYTLLHRGEFESFLHRVGVGFDGVRTGLPKNAIAIALLHEVHGQQVAKLTRVQGAFALCLAGVPFGGKANTVHTGKVEKVIADLVGGYGNYGRGEHSKFIFTDNLQGKVASLRTIAEAIAKVCIALGIAEAK